MSADAVEQLKRLVATGALAQGERLPPERTLSDLLGVSRSTLREAANALVVMGVLEKRQGSGTYVTELTGEQLAQPFVFALDANPKALRDLFEVRLALETHAAAAAATRADHAQLAAMRDLLVTLAAARDRDIDAFVAADLRFHRLIHEASGNAILLQMMASLGALGRHSRMLTAQDPAIREATVHEHSAILDRLEAHDDLGAAECMRRHLAHVRAELDASENKVESAVSRPR